MGELGRAAVRSGSSSPPGLSRTCSCCHFHQDASSILSQHVRMNWVEPRAPDEESRVLELCKAVVGMKGLGDRTGRPGSPSWLNSTGASLTGWPEFETPVWCFTQYPRRESQRPLMRYN